MSELQILRYPDPRLYTVAKPVAEVTDEIRALADAMIALMYAADGVGLAGGPVQPASSSVVLLAPRSTAPDPYAVFEMSRDLRPPDYSTIFARMAVEHSGLDEPLTIAAVIRPPWLAAVADEVGVAQATIREALADYADVV